ncbi:hypothetical protein Pint_11536 [Pistacia integerrima]|uniref:Uncharacterized protein n=1 Tax=Pistacia integerrima TaxID=434235 RepID=A0ACC0XLM7_9ROSI|nr:hypothetical protein Pint_11536 [Pistacia integerrima]
MVAFHLTLENIKVYRLCKDLSLNNLIGQIPSALFSIDSLSHLFLGNNSLSGILPKQKALHLQSIDLSYNYLSGTLPSWVTGLQQLNLVGNNFTFDSSNIRCRKALAHDRVNVLIERKVQCPTRHLNVVGYENLSFAIKCGGGDVLKVDKIVYEADDYDLGGASFVVLDTEKWAVSDIG